MPFLNLMISQRIFGCVDQSANIRVCRSVSEYSGVAISHLKNDQSTIANNRSVSISHLEDCQTPLQQ